MKRDNKFNNILDECLERLLAKDETIAQCLLSYPEYAVELESLLHTVVATKEALAIQPRPEFKSEARYQFSLALQKVEPKRRLPFLGWQPRWAIAMVAFLVLLLAGGGTVAAAGDSMPDSFLYPVKLATEQVQLRLTPSDIGKAELYAKLADRRVAEIVYMVNEGKPEHLEPTAERLNKQLALIVDLSLVDSGEAKSVELAEDEGGRVMLAPPSAAEESGKEEYGEDTSAQAGERTELRTLLMHNSADHLVKLNTVLEAAPESAKPALRRIITELAAGYEKALGALD